LSKESKEEGTTGCVVLVQLGEGVADVVFILGTLELFLQNLGLG
jgi:hypothetical protein